MNTLKIFATGYPWTVRHTALVCLLALSATACSDRADEKLPPTDSNAQLAAQAARKTTPDTTAPAPESLSETDSGETELKARYDEFSRYQNSLKSEFGDLAYELRDASVKAGDRKTVTTNMSRVGYLLKLPKGIAAFSGPEDIEKERKRLAEAEILMNEVRSLADLEKTP